MSETEFTEENYILKSLALFVVNNFLLSTVKEVGDAAVFVETRFLRFALLCRAQSVVSEPTCSKSSLESEISDVKKNDKFYSKLYFSFVPRLLKISSLSMT